nr:DAK2 domain-containing protein [Anaerolineae bacterium]
MTDNPEKVIKTCDGQDLKRLVQAGLAWLEVHFERVNKLNVFPVPDGDTGTNMLLTMRSAYQEIAGIEDQHAGKVAHKLYNGALMGARGNSGVILSQLWRGFSRGIEDQAVLTTTNLIDGFNEAVRTAYQAVQEPVEGTMLTVARETAESVATLAKESDDLVYVLKHLVEASYASVERTPQLLQVLADAGVVDSGGMGLAVILEGMLRLVEDKPIEIMLAEVGQSALQSALEPEDEEGYGYDVQFLLRGSNLEVGIVRETIESMGWSTLVVGDPSLIKVHVHVHNPGPVLGYGAGLGELDDIVVENMQAQYKQFVSERGGPSHDARAPFEMPQIQEGMIAAITVAPGEGLTQILYSLGAASVISGGQTMNPSTKDFIDAINQLPTNRIIILPNNKNIFLAAEQAASQVNGKEVSVIPTRTIPQGISALLALEPRGELEEMIELMSQASTLVETGEVTTSTRDATIDGLAVREGQIIGLHNDQLRISGEDINTVVMDLLEEMGVQDKELITLYYGADVTWQEAHTLSEHITEIYPDHEIEIREGGQPFYFYILSVE